MKRESFNNRSIEMGLEKLQTGHYYSDVHSEVLYKELFTEDGIPVPYLSLFTKGPEQTEYIYNGIISDIYEFVGNEVVNNAVRESIMQLGTPILKENTILNDKFSRMYNEIIIQHETNIPSGGDVFPLIVVENSYDGTRARSISFGICIIANKEIVSSFSFRTKLGTFTQVHKQNANTNVSGIIGNYVNVISDNILNIIQTNFQNKLTEESFFACLDMIEDSVGKRKRQDISSMLSSLNKEGSFTTWDIFLALTQFSTTQKNINSKILLEDVAERVLILPVEIQETLDKINASKS